METCVQIEHHATCQHGRDRTGELRGQDRARLALAVVVLESGERLLACGVIPPDEERRFREGPCARGLANVRARGPGACARRCVGTRDQAAVGDNILDPGETRDGLDRLPQDEAQDVANPRHRVEPVDRLGIGLRGGVDHVSLQLAEPLGIGAHQRQVPFHAFLDRSVGNPRRDARAVGFVGPLFADLRPGVWASRLRAVAQQLRPCSGEIPAAAEQVAGGAPLRGIDRRLREPPAPEPHSHRGCLTRLVCGLAAVAGGPVERVPEYERHVLTSAEVSEPGPGQETLDGPDDIGAIRRHRPEECLWTGLHVLVEQDLPSLIQDADRLRACRSMPPDALCCLV
jgi:hypothetical protein